MNILKGKEIVGEILNLLEMKAPTFAASIGVDYQRIFDIQREKTKKISGDVANAICKTYPQFRIDWLLSGKGEMLNPDDEQTNKFTNNKLIPFYDDVSSIGGSSEMAANMNGISHPSEYIDTGDWFRDATAAIRHYGESMSEYPPGCILALKEVFDRELIVPGRDYSIETSEYRVTKRVQKGKNKDYIGAYSTNTETYPDGRLIHEPFDIPWRAITRISLVLGYVVKKNGGTMVFSNNKK